MFCANDSEGGGVGVRGMALVTARSVSSRLSAQTLGPEVCSGSRREVTQGHAHKGVAEMKNTSPLLPHVFTRTPDTLLRQEKHSKAPQHR